jgi:tetratricopeptide (TPR) repeat protein
VISNGSEKDARQVAAGFEQIRAVFSSLLPGLRTDSGAETIIFATTDQKTFLEMLPNAKKEANRLAGVFRRGWEKDYVIVRLEFPDQTREIVYHEYIHELLRLNFTRLPAWLDEGLAEFYGNTQFRASQVIIGAPSPRLALLRKEAPYPLQTVLSVNQRSPYYYDKDKVGMFYAESWGLTHFLIFGKGMGNGQRMNEYLKLLQQKMDSQQAFAQVFGNPGDVEKLFQEYVGHFAFTAMQTDKPVNVDASSFAGGPMSVAETDASLGGFYNYMGSVETANQWLTAAVAADPHSALAHENLGLLAFRQGNDEMAEKEFDQAASLAPDSYLALYYDAMLHLQAKTDADSLANLDAAMIRVLQLNPRFAPALIVRSQIYVKQGKLQDAYNIAVQAQKLEPDRGGYITHLAAILLLGHNYPVAVKTAETVVARWSTSDGAEALAVINEGRRLGKIEPSAAKQAQESDEMKYTEGTTAVEGVVKSVSCEKSKPMEIVLQSGNQEFSFQSSGPHGVGFSDTLWYGEDHFNSCHHIEGMKAVVRYKPSAEQAAKSEIRWLEIRDDLIPTSPGTPAS